MNQVFTLDSHDVFGVSIFGVLPDFSQESLLSTVLGTYAVVHRVTVNDLLNQGFEILPTFRRPHFTVRVPRPDDTQILLRLFRDTIINPYAVF